MHFCTISWRSRRKRAVDPGTNVDLWTSQVSQNRTDGYSVSDSLMTLTAEWLIPLCFNTHFCFCFLMLSLSLQLARNHAHSIKWLLFHLNLSSTWAGRCWLASGRKWSIAPCPGPHPVHSCHRKRKTICSFYDVLKEHILEGVETEGILIQLCCNVHWNWKIRSHAVPSTLIPSYSGLWFVSQRP